MEAGARLFFCPVVHTKERDIDGRCNAALALALALGRCFLALDWEGPSSERRGYCAGGEEAVSFD